MRYFFFLDSSNRNLNENETRKISTTFNFLKIFLIFSIDNFTHDKIRSAKRNIFSSSASLLLKPITQRLLIHTSRFDESLHRPPTSHPFPPPLSTRAQVNIHPLFALSLNSLITPYDTRGPFTLASRLFISCLLGTVFSPSAYTRFLINPLNLGSKMTLGNASNVSLLLYQLGIPPT